MASTITPNMGLVLPTPGQEPGPQYATDLNNSLSTVDQHNHTAGNGVAITPAGLNLSSDVSFLSNNAIALRSVRFTPQVSPLAGATDLGCLYENGVDLYYNDGNGNQIRMTQSGSIAGASGSITGLASPASVVFSALAATYTFQSDTNVAGNIDAASYTFRNQSPNSTYGITVSAPAALGSNSSITLPAVPGVTSFVTMDNVGDFQTLIPESNGIDGTMLAPNLILGGNPFAQGGSTFLAQQPYESSPFWITRGMVDNSGAILLGSGFTVVKSGTSIYTITFTNPFTGAPVVTVSAAGGFAFGSFPYANVLNTSTTQVVVETGTLNSSGNVLATQAFHFIAIGLG